MAGSWKVNDSNPESSWMICSNCGTVLDRHEEWSYCPVCGDDKKEENDGTENRGS